MQITVLGTGYVGLVAGAGFAEFGNTVRLVDIDEKRIEFLNNGGVPIYEPGLAELINRNAKLDRLSFTTDLGWAMDGSEVIIIAVGTPQAEDGSANLSYVESAACEIGKNLKSWAVIVTKSTVPVGTSKLVRKLVSAETKQEFAVASNPEFLKEGDAINDFMKPARVILGTENERSDEVLKQLYAPFVRTSNRIQIMDPTSAELTKYAANAMLATRISFMNELSQLAEAVGADIERVRVGIGSDPRIGPKFLFPGPGFGGSCFPKDIRALIHTARKNDLQVDVVRAAEEANERQKKVLFSRISEHFGDLKGKKIAVWGLSFKPQTDDIRESPALVLIKSLVAAGASVSAYDPEAMDNTKQEIPDIEYCSDPYSATEGADALALVTEWKEFRTPDFERVAKSMRSKAIFDGRNIWNPETTTALGFRHYSIGRGVFDPK